MKKKYLNIRFVGITFKYVNNHFKLKWVDSGLFFVLDEAYLRTTASPTSSCCPPSLLLSTLQFYLSRADNRTSQTVLQITEVVITYLINYLISMEILLFSGIQNMKST